MGVRADRPPGWGGRCRWAGRWLFWRAKRRTGSRWRLFFGVSPGFGLGMVGGVKWSFLILIPVALAAGGYFLWSARAGDLDVYSRTLRGQFPDVPVVTTAELAGEMGSVWLVDARSAEEFAVSRIAGAVRADDDGVAQLEALGVLRSDQVVVYCSVGYRSAVLARVLQEAGYTNVRNLDGSLFAWANEGRPLVSDDGEVRGVHPFNSRWGRYLDRSLWQWNPSEK